MKKTGFYLVLLLVISGCIRNYDGNLSRMEHPAPDNSQFPFLHAVEDTLYMSWLSHHTGDNSYSLNYTRYTDNQWKSPRTIARDSSWFINWADFPSIVGGSDGPVAAHWLNKVPGGTYAYHVNVSLVDPTGNWSSPVIPHLDKTPTEHGFVSMIPWNNQSVLLVWLDGRQSTGADDDDYYDLSNAMTLRGAIVTAEGEVKKSFLIDDAVCDCCQTSLVKTSGGAVVAYRNRTNNEVRDIYTSHFNGTSWSSPEPAYKDGWEIGACPVNGPKLAAQDSMVVLAWYTAAGEEPVVKAAVSTDEGRSFDQPLQVNEFAAQGRVGAAFHKGVPFVSWIEKEDGKGSQVKVQAVTSNSSPKAIGDIDESRKSGFPQFVSLNNKLIFAWTELSESQPRITMLEYTP